MGITYKELIRRTFLGFPRTDGEAFLVVKQSINDAIKTIANLEEASSLLTTITTSADTVDGQKSYHLTTDLLLTRPKTIYSIRLEDGSNSRKLRYIPHQELDRRIPYPENETEEKPIYYTVFGDYIELYPIPDAAYDIWIRYSQYPAELTSDTDESPYGNEWDTTIVFLSKDIANAYLNGEYLSPGKRLSDLLKANIKNAITQPDRKLIARPFGKEGKVTSEYWKDPFIKGVK